MRRKIFALALGVLLALSLAPGALANMAAPRPADTGTALTFEKNQEIAVLGEVLDIQVEGSQALIRAQYTMKNTTREEVTTPAMFLCPNQEEETTRVTLEGQPLDFTTQEYQLGYNSQVGAGEWEYRIFTSGETPPEGEPVEAISFELTFAPDQEAQVTVEYRYALGGYPDYDFNVKRGEIQYYLQPAAEWKEFGTLTINLYLDEDMPVITQSNLPFEKVASRTYQYQSQGLPEGDLEITIGENWFQKIFSTLRSPYLGMTLLLFSPFLLILFGVILAVILVLRRRKRNRNKG